MLHVRTEGNPDGSPVLLLHGFPQSAAAWDRVWPALADAGHRVLLAEQRGYPSDFRPRGRRAYRVPLLVEDVVAALDEPVHVVGHDWGGVVGWALAASRPELVRSLTVVSTPHPRALARALRTADQARRSWYVLAFQLPVLPERLLLANGGRRLRGVLRGSGLDADTAREYAARMSEPGALTAALNWYRALPLAGRSIAGPVPVRTLYVWGEEDFALGRRAAEDTGRYVTGPYEFVPLPGVSHWVPEQHADELLPPLLRHLAGG